MSPQGVMLDVNEAFVRMLGYERHELVGTNLLEIVHPDEHHHVTRVHEAMRSGLSESLQLRRIYICKNGEALHAIAGVVALRAPDGRLVGILKQVHDVSRRVRAERMLQQSLAQQRVVLDALAEGVIVCDADGRVRVSNPSARQILGVSAKELHGRRSQAVVRIADDDGDPIEADALPVRQALRTGKPVMGHVLEVLREDGTSRWVRVNARPLVRPGLDDTIVVASLADVTPLKAREREVAWRDLHDPATGLPNRRYFLGHVARRALSGDRRGDAGGAVLAVDLARLERVSDLYGRRVESGLLAQVAERIAGAVTGGDLAARLGGDAFCAYLPGVADADAAVAAGQRLVDAVGAPFSVGGVPLSITVSVGATLIEPDDDDAEAVLDRAEAALLRAKADGRRGPVAFDPVDETVRHRIRLGRDLAAAHDRDELAVAFDPVVRLQDGHAVGERSRLCWTRPQDGEVDPDTTRALARLAGLEGELCRLSLSSCLRRIHSLPDPDAQPRQPVMVSVSPDMLLVDGVQRFRTLLADTGLRAESLVLAVDADDDAEDLRLAGAAESVAQLGFGLMLEHGGQRRTRTRAASEFPYQWLGVHHSAIRRGLSDRESGRTVTRSRLHDLRDAGVRTVAETVAGNAFGTEELRSLGFDYRYGTAEPAV